MGRNLIDDPEFWRSRAEEVRVIAEELKDADAKSIMNRIADDYERLANTHNNGGGPVRSDAGTSISLFC